jgi:hypothetical protein
MQDKPKALDVGKNSNNLSLFKFENKRKHLGPTSKPGLQHAILNGLYILKHASHDDPRHKSRLHPLAYYHKFSSV